jgi:hypothetical protein
MVFGLFKKDRDGRSGDSTRRLEALANAPVGAPVEVEGRRGVIRGSLIVEESGDRWIEHLIDDAGGFRYWVSIENFATTVATLWSDVDIWDVNGGPDDTRVSHNGVSYRRNEVGTARYTATGDVDLINDGTVDYVDFAGPDGSRFSFERFGEAGASRRARSISGLCPNCQAPLNLDLVGACTSCGSSLMEDHGWFDTWEVAQGRDVTDSARLQ